MDQMKQKLINYFKINIIVFFIYNTWNSYNGSYNNFKIKWLNKTESEKNMNY